MNKRDILAGAKQRRKNLVGCRVIKSKSATLVTINQRCPMCGLRLLKIMHDEKPQGVFCQGCLFRKDMEKVIPFPNKRERSKRRR